MSPRPRLLDGCTSMIWMCLVTCLFLIFNGAMVAALYEWVSPVPHHMRKLTQALLYVGPVLLIFPQWWLVDRLIDRLMTARTTAAEKREKASAERWHQIGQQAGAAKANQAEANQHDGP